MNAQDKALLEKICAVSGDNPKYIRRVVIPDMLKKILDGRLG